jgi:NADH-quinone oxidoreductase subunit H
MPKIPQMKIQTFGLGIFGALLFFVGVLLILTPVRERVQDIFWFVVKIAFFMYLYIWYRGTFPRYRFDQLMKVGWKVLLPTGLGVLIATAIAGLLPQIGSAILGVLR